jgi:hypothetical protein
MELCSSVLNTHRFIDSTYFQSTIITSTTTSSKQRVPWRSSLTKICHAFLITKQFHDTRILDQLPSIKKVYYGTRKFIITKNLWIQPTVSPIPFTISPYLSQLQSKPSSHVPPKLPFSIKFLNQNFVCY